MSNMHKGFSQLFLLIALVLVLSTGIGFYAIQKGSLSPEGYEYPTATPSVQESFSSTPTPVVMRCVVGGCSGELCITEDKQDLIVSICLYKSEYACYKKARCEIQANHVCGWTQTSELVACIKRER